MNFINGDVQFWNILLINSETTESTVSGLRLESRSDINGVLDLSQYVSFVNLSEYINDTGLVYNNGTWTLREEQVSAVPVPAALPLMARLQVCLVL